MHIVRVNHKNGLLLEFLYTDPGKADECARICAEAKLRGNAIPPQASPAHVIDEAGRETWLDGQCIQSVQIADLQHEVVRNTMVRIQAEQDASAVLARAGFASTDASPTNGHAAPPGPNRNPMNDEDRVVDDPRRATPAIGRFAG